MAELNRYSPIIEGIEDGFRISFIAFVCVFIISIIFAYLEA